MGSTVYRQSRDRLGFNPHFFKVFKAQMHSICKILIAPDSFKGSLPNDLVAQAIKTGIQDIWPDAQIDICPVADGGEGTIDALIASEKLSARFSQVPAESQGTSLRWGSRALERGRAGWFELAEVVGFSQIGQGDSTPETRSTHLAGILMNTIQGEGVRELNCGLGGTSTIDGGVGALAAMGVIFRDASGAMMSGPMTGGHLIDIASYEVPQVVRSRWAGVHMRMVCDVMSPLLGECGAAKIFGPQKGASPEAIGRLEKGLANWARIVGGDPHLPGSGAAGGFGFGMKAIFDATLEKGSDRVLADVDFDQRCQAADLVITGEGALDAQSRLGKITVELAQRARRLGIDTWAIVGRKHADFGPSDPFRNIRVLSEMPGVEDSMVDTALLIRTVFPSFLDEL